MKGLEPPRLSAPDPKSGAATITPHPRENLCKDIDFLSKQKISEDKDLFKQGKATSEM